MSNRDSMRIMAALIPTLIVVVFFVGGYYFDLLPPRIEVGHCYRVVSFQVKGGYSYQEVPCP